MGTCSQVEGIRPQLGLTVYLMAINIKRTVINASVWISVCKSPGTKHMKPLLFFTGKTTKIMNLPAFQTDLNVKCWCDGFIHSSLCWSHSVKIIAQGKGNHIFWNPSLSYSCKVFIAFLLLTSDHVWMTVSAVIHICRQIKRILLS